MKEWYYPKLLGILYIISCDIEHKGTRLCYGWGCLIVRIELVLHNVKNSLKKTPSQLGTSLVLLGSLTKEDSDCILTDMVVRFCLKPLFPWTLAIIRVLAFICKEGKTDFRGNILGQLYATSVLVKAIANMKYMYLLIYHMQHQGPRGQETTGWIHVLKILGEHVWEWDIICEAWQICSTVRANIVSSSSTLSTRKCSQLLEI